jgi:hypothetical protein
MTLFSFVVMPAAMIAVNAWAFRRNHNPWSLFTAGFATCWLMQGLFAWAFGKLEFSSQLDWYYGLGIAVGVVTASLLIWWRHGDK